MQDAKPNAEAVNDRVKLLFHRLIARRLKYDPTLIDQARKDLERQRAHFGERYHIIEWEQLLDQGVEVVRREIVSRSQRMTRLRISSPLGMAMDVRDVSLRRRIWRSSSNSLARRMNRSAAEYWAIAEAIIPTHIQRSRFPMGPPLSLESSDFISEPLAPDDTIGPVRILPVHRRKTPA